MDDLDKHIDDLFRSKLSGAEMPGLTSGAEWMQLSKTIRRRNFLRFSPGSFNVYYLASAVGVVATTGAIGLFDMGKNISNINPPIEPSVYMVDTVAKPDSTSGFSDSTFMVDPVIMQPGQKKKFEQPKSRCPENEVGASGPSATDSCHIAPLKSEHSISASQSDSLENENRIPPVKLVSQPIVPDTIVKVDTIRVKKKEVKLKRKLSKF